MRISQIGLGGSLAIVLLACGGSAPPAQTGGAGGPPANSLDNSGSSGSGPAASAPSSPDTDAGIKAFDAGNYADARKSFEAATKKNANDYGAFFNLGMTCEKLGDPPGAEAAYKAALALKPDLDQAAAGLSSLYLDAGRNDEALAVARNGLANHPGSEPLHANMAVALAAKGDQDNATKEFTSALQINPKDAMVHLTFAHWLNMWKVRGAAPHLDAARDLAGEDVPMLVSIGHEYRMAAEFDSCIKTFDRTVSIKDGGEARTERALCRHGLKDEKGMLADLQAAVAAEPTYAPAHYYLAGRLAASNNFKEAAAEYAKVLQLAPNGSLAKPAAEKLKMAQDASKKK